MEVRELLNTSYGEGTFMTVKEKDGEFLVTETSPAFSYDTRFRTFIVDDARAAAIILKRRFINCDRFCASVHACAWNYSKKTDTSKNTPDELESINYKQVDQIFDECAIILASFKGRTVSSNPP